MGRELPSKKLQIYKQFDEVLHYLWDPIGVAEYPEARDEYESCVPQVYGLIQDGAGADEVAEFLVRIEAGTMGLPPNLGKAKKAAAVLLAWRTKIEGETP